MKRTLSDRLFAAAPSSVAAPGVVDTIPDLQRILALPRRPPVVCELDPRTRRYPPVTQALVEVQTAKFSRGARISCACRPRVISLGFDGVLTISRVLPEDEVPEPPVQTTLQAFIDNNQTMGDADALRAVKMLQPGQEVSLPAADGAIGHPCITTLMPVQAWFLREAEQLGGVVGMCGVGSGKSISLLLSPLLFPDSRLAVLVIEPKQRQHYRSQYLRLREHFRVSSIVCDVAVSGGTVPGTTPLHLISYSVLSRTSNSDLLDRLLPDVLLLDEAHRACGQSAINRRIKRYVASRIRAREDGIARGEAVRSRAVRLLDASGTLEVKSVNDTQMLCTFSLGMGSPLPLDPNEAVAWSNVMDVSYQPDRTSSTAKNLYKAFGVPAVAATAMASFFGLERGDTELRKGFQKWRAATPGIITATVSNVNAAIYFGEYEVPKMPTEVLDALMKVRVEWLRPDGDEFIEKMEQLACAKSVACGFYPYWAFPTHPCTCAGAADIKCPQCLLIEDWYAKRKLFNKELRVMLQLGEVQLDSQKLCEDAADRALEDPPALNTYCDTCWRNGVQCKWPCEQTGHRPGWRSLAWKDWKAIENKVEYEERVRWIGHDLPAARSPETHPGYFLARDLARWARKNKGIVWFQSIALGRKISELSGLPYFNGGPGGEDRLRAEKGDRSIIVSIPAHGAGTDGLQLLFNDQVIAEMPASNASARGIEQVLGRLHRPGQRKDEVNTLACLHVRELKDALRKAIQQAEFNFQMTGNRQKILIADMDVDEL